MLLIDCPFCGKRPEGEFSCLGEAVAPRPDPAGLDDDTWSAWLVGRENRRGFHSERWWHVRSCGRVFTITRDTVTHAIQPHAEAGQ
ncbi:MAG TPA: sarcosine oxidase subunit delta [Beijerinckiaceae bacterium]|nr:sarcosine oxidase subunit delta [Beijerinckiaceae bacterium]